MTSPERTLINGGKGQLPTEALAERDAALASWLS